MRRRLRAFAYVVSLLALGSAVWLPTSIYAQVIPTPSGGSGTAASAPFSDATALVKNESDATKLFKVDASGLTTANTATMTLSGTAAAPVWTATGWTVRFGAGNSGTPSISFAGDTNSGFWSSANDDIGISTGGSHVASINGTAIRMISSGQVGFTSGAPTASIDSSIRRLSAGVITQTAGTATSIGTMLGGGGAVASADPLPAFTGNVFHVTGTTNFTNFTTTNFVTGACATLIFDGILTMTDGGNMKLSANFTTSPDDTLTVCFDGSNWYEVARSVN